MKVLKIFFLYIVNFFSYKIKIFQMYHFHNWSCWPTGLMCLIFSCHLVTNSLVNVIKTKVQICALMQIDVEFWFSNEKVDQSKFALVVLSSLNRSAIYTFYRQKLLKLDYKYSEAYLSRTFIGPAFVFRIERCLVYIG